MNKLVIMLLVSMAFAGCYYDNEEDLYPNSVTVNDTATVTYSADISPLISAYCATPGCHVANGQSPDLSDYNKLKANIDRVKVRALDLKTMPASGPLSLANRTKLQKWIDAGALNN